MGVYIPNMKKERYCEECPLSGTRHIDIYEYVFCELLDEYVDEAKKHCPLIDIVTCGECKQLDHTKWCDLFLHYMNEDDFCSKGERRADEILER